MAGKPDGIRVGEVDFGSGDDPRVGFDAVVTQYRSPRKWLLMLLLAASVACAMATVAMFVIGMPLVGLPLAAAAVGFARLRAWEAEDRRDTLRSCLVARHGEEAILSVPGSYPLAHGYADRVWLFPEGTIQYAVYEGSRLRIGVDGAFDIRMRDGREVSRSTSERDRITVRPEGADAEDAGREAADILFPKVAEASAVAGLDRLFE